MARLLEQDQPAQEGDLRQGPFDVVMPAGGRISGEFAAAAGTEVKALIRLGEETILRRMIKTLRATGQVRRIAAIGPEEVREEALASGADGALEEGATGPQNIFRGLEWMLQGSQEPAPRVLVITTDLPFLTPDALCRFLQSAPPESDLSIPVVSREAFEARFPDSANIYVKLRGGSYTLGCAFLLNPRSLLENRVHVENVFQARKSQVLMARLLGVLFILRLLTRRLTVGHIEQRCGQILRCVGAAVPGSAAELAFDIDDLEEYQYARAHFGDGPGVSPGEIQPTQG